MSCTKIAVAMCGIRERSRKPVPQSIRKAIDDLNQAERFLDGASTLLEIAEDIRAASLNSDLRKINC